MELKIEGIVIRASHLDQGLCEQAIDLSENSPANWRECLAQLLPGIGESE
jgi:hypothetical protein